MKKFTQQIRYTAIVAALAGIAVASPASANVVATSILDISNLKFVNNTTNETLNNVNNVQVTGGNNYGNTSADLFSVPGTQTDTQSATIFSSPGVFSSTGGAFNGDQVFEGSGAMRADNDYSLRTAPPPGATNSFAYANNELNGTSIDLDIDGDGVIDLVAGVSARTISMVELNTTDVGNALSNTGTNFTFDFISLTDQTVRFDFDYVIQALAYVEPGSATPSTATAGVSWNIQLTDGTTTQSYNPNALNLTSSRTDTFAGLTNQFNTSGSFGAGPNALVFQLIAGTTYQVGITHNTQVNATSTIPQVVPEPGILALLGLGLAAFAVPGARRRQD